MDEVNRQIRIGVKKDGGPPPTYQWSVGILDVAHEEAMSVLTPSQHRHMALQVKELARQGDPTHSDLVDVEKVDDFYEIRDRGGPLGGINVRLFFAVVDSERWMLVLGFIKKQNNGKTPLGDKTRMARRLRKFRSGEYGKLPI